VTAIPVSWPLAARLSSAPIDVPTLASVSLTVRVLTWVLAATVAAAAAVTPVTISVSPVARVASAAASAVYSA
jgi:hypothetical protein